MQKANKQFKDFMESLPSRDKIPTRNKIIEACNIHTMTYYNWTAGTCYISDERKAIIEQIAGTKIFSDEVQQHNPIKQ
jgi:hypothetical protein